MTGARYLPRGSLLGLAGLAMGIGLSACSSIGGFTGAAAGIATGTVSGNPAVALGVGVAVQAGTDQLVKHVTRRRQQTEQDEIATVIGGMQIGETRAWEARHTIPIGNEHGVVKITRIIDNPLAQCRELLYSVVDGKGAEAKSNWYVANACLQGQTWKWASAEPAVERWGNLQ
ncbi:MAG: hypothetical protein ACRYG5_16355 [Janthinobacterium lividum]